MIYVTGIRQKERKELLGHSSCSFWKPVKEWLVIRFLKSRDWSFDIHKMSKERCSKLHNPNQGEFVVGPSKENLFYMGYFSWATLFRWA